MWRYFHFGKQHEINQLNEFVNVFKYLGQMELTCAALPLFQHNSHACVRACEWVSEWVYKIDLVFDLNCIQVIY